MARSPLSTRPPSRHGRQRHRRAGPAPPGRGARRRARSDRGLEGGSARRPARTDPRRCSCACSPSPWPNTFPPSTAPSPRPSWARPRSWPTTAFEVPDGFKVFVIGAGVSGLCAAINLQAAGDPFEIVERNPTVGGVWWENKYPGAGVDTPNHLYSFSFAEYDWKQYFCLRDELQGYLEHVSDRFDIRPRIEFKTTVTRIAYDETRKLWAIETRDQTGKTSRCARRTWSSAPPASSTRRSSPRSTASTPGPARSGTPPAGPTTALFAGKRVAIIGNGASCMQTGPEIQNEVESLTIYQRSNHWAAPFDQFRKPVPDAMRFLFQECPLYRNWYRVRSGLDVQRPHPHGPAQGPELGASRAFAQRPERRPPRLSSRNMWSTNSATGPTSCSPRCFPPTRRSASAC